MKNKFQEALEVVNNTGADLYYAAKTFYEKYGESHYDVLQELVNKATPKKPITIKPKGPSIWDYPTDRIKCPNCNTQLPMKKTCLKKKVPITHCDRCGQKLDWDND